MDRTITISNFPELSLFSENEDIQAGVELIQEEQGLAHYRFSFPKDSNPAPKAITLRWKVPFLNMGGIWKSGEVQNKRQQYDWELEHLKTRISVDAPVVSVFGLDDINAMTFACSDALNLLELNAVLREEDNHLYCHITFFSEPQLLFDDYEADIRIDTRAIDYVRALQEVSSWWETFPRLKPAKVPELATVPLYSTWYQFHQDLDADRIIRECTKAVNMGLNLIIIDDGWQTLDANRGYDYTGDWQADRFSDMAQFVAQLHDIGMKVGLWFSVPFCGKYSKAYQKFKGKFLTENHRWAPVFDPRYPEVRQHLIAIYVAALKNWDLDAFKLDFIDDFKVYPETELSQANGRDYASVDAAVERLLADVIQALRELKPNVAIEFRQKYVGPMMRRFGNMFRAFDCPNDPVSNRIRTTDVKLLCGSSAVHSDPYTWHPEEAVEIAALQFINGFFAVPQLSVFLEDLPVAHQKMIQFFLQYWSQHKSIILKGEFQAINPTMNYPVLTAEKNGHAIIGIYENVVVDLVLATRIDILNGKPSENIVLRNSRKAGTFRIITWNCMGEKELDQLIHIKEGLTEIKVKTGGLIQLEQE